MQQVVELFQQYRLANSEAIRQAEVEIDAICADASSFFVFCEIVKNVPEVREFAVVLGINRVLPRHWKVIGGTQDGEVVKENLGMLLKGLKNDAKLINNLVYGIRPIIFSKDIDWLLTIVREDPVSICSLLILDGIIKAYGSDLSVEIANFALQVVAEVLKKQDVSMVVAAANVFAGVCHHISEDAHGTAVEVFSSLWMVFLANPTSHEFAKALSKTLDFKDRFADPKVLFEQSMEHIRQNVNVVFILLRKIMSIYGCELRPIFPQFIKFCLDLGAELFTGNCCDEEEDVTFVVSIVHKCARVSDPKEFLEMFVTFLSGDSPNSLFASIVGLTYVVYDLGAEIIAYSQPIAEFLIASLKVDHHAIREIAVDCISEIMEYASEALEAALEQLIPMIMEQACAPHEKLSLIASRSLSNIVGFGEDVVGDETLFNVCATLLGLIKQAPPQVKAELIRAIGAAITSLGEKSTALAGQVIPVFLEGIEDENSVVVCTSIQAFGLFFYSTRRGMKDCAEIGPVLHRFIEFLIGEIASDVDNAILTASFFAMSMLARTYFGIEPFLDLAIIYSLKIMQKVSDPNVHLTGEIFDVIASALSFMRIVVKRRRRTVKVALNLIPVAVMAFIGSNDEDTASAAGLLGAELGMNSPDYLKALKNNMISTSKRVVGSTFQCLYKLMRLGVSIPREFIQFAMATGMKIFKREHACFEEDHGDHILLRKFYEATIGSVINFFSACASTNPSEFPIQDVINLLTALIPMVTDEEIECTLDIVCSYVRSVSGIPSTVMADLFQFAWQFIKPEILCDEPYALVRVIFEACPELMTPQEVKTLFETPQSRPHVLLSATLLLLSYAIRVAPFDAATTAKLVANLTFRANLPDIQESIVLVLQLLEKYPDLMPRAEIVAKFSELLNNPRKSKLSPEVVSSMETVCI